MGPARFHCATLLYVGVLASSLNQEVTSKQNKQGDGKDKPEKRLLSEVGFEPTPTEVDCDLNAAP